MSVTVEIGGNDFTFAELKEAVQHLQITVEELFEMQEEDNVRTFPNYHKFFFWYYEDFEKEELIKFMWDEDVAPPSDQYFNFPDGRVIFIYE